MATATLVKIFPIDGALSFSESPHSVHEDLYGHGHSRTVTLCIRQYLLSCSNGV